MAEMTPAEKVARIQEVCPIPETAARVMRLCGEADFDLQKITQAIATDAALASEVLRLANSPGFGGRREVADLPHAVSMIGVQGLGNIATAMAMMGAFRSKVQDQLPFYETSVLSGGDLSSLGDCCRCGQGHRVSCGFAQ